MPAVTAITFDFWNTLMREPTGDVRDARAAAWLGLLEGAGFAVERRAIDRAMASAWGAFTRAWRANEQFDAAASAEHCLAELGLEVPGDLREELVRTLVDGEDRDIEPTPNIEQALAACKEAGLKIGIICDVGLTPSTKLRGALEKHGLLRYFDGWSFSDEVGVYKPDGRIFEHARATLGVDGRYAHVGDLRRTDVTGARAAGWLAIRYAGMFDDASDTPDADHVIRDHAQLAGVLSLD